MTPSTRLSDPTDLDGLRHALAARDPQSRLLPIGLQQVVISEKAHLEVAAALHNVLPDRHERPAIVILTDTTPIRRGGLLLSDAVLQQVTAEFDARVARLDDGHKQLHADDTVLDMATEAVKGAAAVVTIGSGTMTDIGKIATMRNGNIPQIAVQTAASVDGFTDNVSVILRNGVKRTVPSRWPTVVLADVTTIGAAPREMNTSGFGEAISLFTAPADWYLSSLVGLDSTFHPASMAMLKAAASDPPLWSAGVATGEATATRELTRLLALRGIVSGVSNTTACLSGVEHVISHMLDLHHAAKHMPIGLHGAQVGVATLIAAKLWRSAIDGDLIRPGLLQAPDLARYKARIEAAFGHLGDGIAAECWHDCQIKIGKVADNWERFEAVASNWREHAAEFDKMVLPANDLRRALQASGSPATFQRLSPSISAHLARWAVSNCHLMRNRFNLVDLLDLMGLWTADRIAWALQDTLEGAA